MLMNALKPQNTKITKASEEIKEEDDEVAVLDQEKPVKKALKKKKTLGSTSTSFKKPQDSLTRFFNSYGETPHLQAIEDSYLQYL
jgi:S-adenosylmethionine:tRNA-ribosyltransferase-isomerase (queuine synthetase)